MAFAALTGISPAIIEELKRGKPRTVELASAHNVITLTGVKAGDHIFLTPIDCADLGPGDPGIMVEVNSVAISMKHSVEFANPVYFEERERMAARMQVRYCGASVVKQVESRGMGRPVLIEAVKTTCYHAH
ncbi:MAG TPA: DUF473 domain-containing protein [Methanomicrobiales archaeon]|nr:DUF473 domain-containing protein [Methanomicrobiales archaeon]